jgi:hypothetical protein
MRLPMGSKGAREIQVTCRGRPGRWSVTYLSQELRWTYAAESSPSSRRALAVTTIQRSTEVSRVIRD